MGTYRNIRNSRYTPSSGFGFLFAAFAALVLLVGGCNYAVNKATEKTVEFTVRDKDRVTKCDSEGSCQSYWIVMTDNGVYKNDDSLMYFKFRSSDLQAELEDGKRFRCKTAGFRIGITSSYPNLISCERIG